MALTLVPHAAVASPPAGAAPTPTAAANVAALRSGGYDRPPQAILDVMHAPSLPWPSPSPTGASILLVAWEEFPSIARVAEPFLGLAGLRVEPRTRRKHDTPGGYGIMPCAREISIVDVATSVTTKVALPSSGCVDSPLWAASGKQFLLQRTAGDAVELWLGDAARGTVHRVGDLKLNPMTGRNTVQWMPDGKTLLVKLVPQHPGKPPVAPVGSDGPSIQESTGEKGESSSYEARDTLNSKYSEDLFDYYAAAQLALVDTQSGRVTRIGKPGVIVDVAVAPDGQHILVQTVHKPYSYVTTFERFPREVEVWNRAGVVTHKLASLPLQDRVPIHGVPTGPRHFSWRANAPATLTWVEALDGGDPNVKAPLRDKLLMQAAPFDKSAVEVTRLEQRFDDILWGEQPSVALLVDEDINRHWTRTFVIDVDAPASKPRLLFDHSTDEHYKHPGTPVMRQLPSQARVVRQDGSHIFLQGVGSSPDGDRPFLDRLDLQTLKTERLFRSEKSAYERFLAFTDQTQHTLATWHQSPTEPPNAFLRTLGAPLPAVAPGEPEVASTARPLTKIADPTPAVRSIHKRLVHYKRKDGLDLSFTLYTPPGYKEGTRLPAILNAYPLDYADPKMAGQVTGSQQEFTQLFQYQLLLLAGYAIIDSASFPIIGDPKKAYDHYLDQLVADAAAAVDKAVELGVVDRDRIGVTGHSHGALMTANLVAHSSLFRAGVATSGAYNKTLVPFGFQNERRSVWSAQSVYLQVSPFFFAHTLKVPLLLVHGQEDANPGTPPMEARNLYEAIRGNGGTTRLVMLPHEPHWYAAMESNEQLAYEMVRWFDMYVKNAPPATHAANP